MLAVCLVVAAATRSTAGEAAASSCDAGGVSQPVRVLAVDERFDIALADGRIATIPGVQFDPGAETRRMVGAWLIGADARIETLTPHPDRWGRWPAQLSVRRSGPDRDTVEKIGLRAVETGLAIWRPDPLARGCRDPLLAAERRAREARLGLWADSARRPIPATDRTALAAAPRGLVLVEGVVTSVGRASGRVYLNFGEKRSRDLAIVIFNRDMTGFESRGLAVQNLLGRRLRARGVIDVKTGPVLEISDPDALELVDDGSPAAKEG